VNLMHEEHRRCGALDGGVEEGRQWMMCECGAQMAHDVAAPGDPYNQQPPVSQRPGAISGATRWPFPSVSVHFCPLATSWVRRVEVRGIRRKALRDATNLKWWPQRDSTGQRVCLKSTSRGPRWPHSPPTARRSRSSPNGS
jgi:hypothetical protein